MKENPSDKKVKSVPLESATVLFAGDSGDGIQLIGHKFADAAAQEGSDLGTLPDYPAEIKAPAGSLGGVSGFQVNFGDDNVMTPGTKPDVLIAMNPAALKVNLSNMEKGSILVLNSDNFDSVSLKKAGYESNPLNDGSLANYRVIQVPANTLTEGVLKDSGMSKSQMLKCKNFYMLGLVYWMYSMNTDSTVRWIKEKFKNKPHLAKANAAVFVAGYNYAEATQIFEARFQVKKRKLEPGKYRNLTGNEAVAYALLTAAKLANRKLFYGSYPITPASDILHTLARYRGKNTVVFQAEDEISAACACIGASFAGAIAATGTSGPGFSLKSESLGMAVMCELPLVVINVQRAGPSTGLPTKTEQGDLMQAIYGRHGEAPLVVLAASSPADCFDMTLKAVRIAVKYMTPVVLLSNAYLANGSEPFRIPDLNLLPKIESAPPPPPDKFQPYMRNPETLARYWTEAGKKGYEHRTGGLEKEHMTGKVTYDPKNHAKMCQFRMDKINGVAREIPPTEVFGDSEGELLIVGWGSTYGAITTAVLDAGKLGLKVSSVNLKYLNPLPPDLGTVMRRFGKVLVAEEGFSQLRTLLKARYMIDGVPLNKVEGMPLNSDDVFVKIKKIFAR